jgi:hypothetical protein
MNAKLHLLVAISLSLLSSVDAAAQSASPSTYRLHCQSIPGARDDIAAAAGRALIAGGYTCRVEGGPMNGGVTTGSTLGEITGDNYVGFSGGSVTRRPGSLLVTVHSEFGNKTLRDADGKFKDSQGTGRGRYVLATGDAAPYSGKGYRYVTRFAGPGMFDVDVTPE